ncbi:hypothetical protein [Natronoglycomyces albus]|uniref:Uncharacterized protein n=1 Tax=Natronoglycomyces albus TaxID=2811108 RepID=A0A895XN58_9ACTN|nr:hypothetical protein [Natronoglycomyces albus]QSB05212.1 hypothetical protein JQS30_15870 [Natronoglycomyces albus]
MTSSRSIYRRLLQATFLGDREAMAVAAAELEGKEVTWADSGLLAASVFTLAVRDWFADSVDEAGVKELALAASDRSDQELSTVKTVIWSALGHDNLVDEVSPMQRMRAQVAIVTEIITKAEGTAEEVSGLMDQAEQMLDEM